MSYSQIVRHFADFSQGHVHDLPGDFLIKNGTKTIRELPIPMNQLESIPHQPTKECEECFGQINQCTDDGIGKRRKQYKISEKIESRQNNDDTFADCIAVSSIQLTLEFFLRIALYDSWALD